MGSSAMGSSAMGSSAIGPAPVIEGRRLRSHFDRVRAQTARLAEPLSEADATVQSMPDASPAKWHLAHTSWFFEAMVLEPYRHGYRSAHPAYRRLFNSYYESLGERHPRPQRGLLTRPSLDDVLAYRARIEQEVRALLEQSPPVDALALIELGCHHEQQHQELLLTDILHLFAQNPLRPAYSGDDPLPTAAVPLPASRPVPLSRPVPMRFVGFDGGVVPVGHEGSAFAFDCEGPRHQVVLEPFALANRPVTNREWLEFIDDGGYRQPLLWLSDGWARVVADDWQAPLYWEPASDPSDGLDRYRQMTLRGLCRLDPDAPVCHLSYFEADAFAQWAGARLPTEFEWERVACLAGSAVSPAGRPEPAGHFADSGCLRPQAISAGPAARDDPRAIHQLFGDVWEWTRSPFSPYPRFRPSRGAVGEYNGKFMCGQFVLRGGSCVTPAEHLRSTYRNFFPPQARWQFTGLRLARDA